jgi:hypothetical protein
VGIKDENNIDKYWYLSIRSQQALIKTSVWLKHRKEKQKQFNMIGNSKYWILGSIKLTYGMFKEDGTVW